MGVLEKTNEYEWGSPYFAQPKLKTNWVHFISYFSNLNRKFKQNPYTMPKINDMLLKMEGFK